MVTEKLCPKCEKVKSASEFSLDSRAKSGLSSWCKKCNNARNTVGRHARNLRYFYQITPAEYNSLLVAQGGRCAICGNRPGKKRLAVDHDHGCCPGIRTCGKCIRGLLCSRCNLTLLGQICKESKEGVDHALEILQKAGEYLKRNKTADS